MKPRADGGAIFLTSQFHQKSKPARLLPRQLLLSPVTWYIYFFKELRTRFVYNSRERKKEREKKELSDFWRTRKSIREPELARACVFSLSRKCDLTWIIFSVFPIHFYGD